MRKMTGHNFVGDEVNSKWPSTLKQSCVDTRGLNSKSTPNYIKGRRRAIGVQKTTSRKDPSVY